MIISSDLFENWQECLENFHKGVKKDLDEIRNYKNEIQDLKREICDRLDKGTYIKDDNRIILSAPEIIIGDVDQSGYLKGAATNVVIRGTNINIEGTGSGKDGIGTIVCRAPFISQQAVDPGPDGFENTVKGTSIISSQAHAISLNSSSSEGFFPENGTSTGIQLTSDTNIQIESTLSNKIQKERLKESKENLKKQLKEVENEANSIKKEVDDLVKDIQKIVKKDTFDYDWDSLRTDAMDIAEIQDEFNHAAETISTVLPLYYAKIAELAELNRALKCVEEQTDIVSKQKGDFEKKTTNTSITIASEYVDISSADGDGNIRTNENAGINIEGKTINLSGLDYDGTQIKDSAINVHAENIDISTSNPDIKGDKGEEPAIGTITVTSKNIVMEGVDYEYKNGKPEEKTLTKAGSFYLRFEDIKMDTTGTDGKADGHIGINSKQVEVKTMDVDKDSRKDKSLTAGSSLLLLSEKIFTGSKEKNTKSKLLQLASDEIAVIGEKTVELQQDKAIVQLSGGNTSLSGGKTQIYGTITMNGKTSFKADVDAGDIDVKNIKIQSSFKSPCTSEGMAVPGAPSTAKLNAKLKEEEFKSTDK